MPSTPAPAAPPPAAPPAAPAATPPGTAAPPPAAKPAAVPAPAKPAAPAPPPKIPRSGTLRDVGVVWREAVHALRWTARGAVKVQGEADAGDIQLAGPASIGGVVTTDYLRADGTLDCGSSVDVTGALLSNGSLRTRGTVHCGQADLRGVAHLLGDLKVDRGLVVHGALLAPSIQATNFQLDGTLDVAGDVDAQRVDLHFREKSAIGTVRAASVRLVARPPNPIEMVRRQAVRVTVLRVEATAVEIDGVDVRFVRAPEITLGRNAHVTEFEGKIVRRHPSARVGPESRSPPPHGLSR